MQTTRKPCHLILAGIEEGNRLGIGLHGVTPWSAPKDMAYFRKTTANASVIMGRKTWDSIPVRFRPLAGRHNIVVSKNAAAHKNDEKVDWTESVEEALSVAQNNTDTERIFIIGGGSIYDYFVESDSWPYSPDRLYVTIIESSSIEFDTYFPLEKCLSTKKLKLISSVKVDGCEFRVYG